MYDTLHTVGSIAILTTLKVTVLIRTNIGPNLIPPRALLSVSGESFASVLIVSHCSPSSERRHVLPNHENQLKVVGRTSIHRARKMTRRH
jgi:hypothetical protein